ncbi:GNAT family N-acetyltransferase [Mycolicibacterium boenickei]|uniref:Acetyltransferase Pat n=1 Tax=Mycolicibacterium boenickei TaxID=146017 RepID=A0AAX3A0P4_9MYCO|nr:GNAT family N-acetyltransferase [Mycolicibacterium boenickei]PEG58805.1 GNAT family N-acetyltransferase [Mycolicibacterium boenickei]UNC01032.1 GNAT family N-acetyltransferase [Mycolicibacterium boenickei]BBX90856.1 acetyltransferase Pat [Mycolicibacterium boenickei]
MADLTEISADDLAALEFFAGCRPPVLAPLTALLRPLAAVPGQVLIRQGDPALTFMLIASGRTRVVHEAADGQAVVADLEPGLIIGEIALLRDAARTATVTALDPVSGWVGDRDAFEVILHLPGMFDRLVRIARQRLAGFITPIPVQMRNGDWFYLRPVLPGDVERTLNGPVEFSSETLYRRFQSVRKPTKALLEYLFEVDYADHFVWVMTEGALGPVVADARVVREGHDATTAEVAFTVGDDYQGRGIGTFLMDALVVSANYLGIQRFTARVLSDNYAMRRILDRLGAVWEREDLGVVLTDVAVPAIDTLSLEPELAAKITDVTRQVIRAVSQ